MLRDMDVEISAELEEEEEIYRDGIRKCIAALRYHHKRAETCSNGYTGSTLEEDTLKSINFLKRNNIAAMLQGAKPVSQTYKLPVNTPCKDAPAHIWLQTAGVWPEDGELSELTWCSHNQHHDDTLYVRADLVNGNSPVTPDSWISCSKRMPDTKTAVLVAVEFDRKGDWRMKWATYIPGHPDANDGWIIPGASWKPS
ncbi:DUF551 domain-containing protein, partial [Escherichia coli]